MTARDSLYAALRQGILNTGTSNWPISRGVALNFRPGASKARNPEIVHQVQTERTRIDVGAFESRK